MLSDSIVRTYTDALLAADASIKMFDVNVLVYPEVDFANDLFRTGFDTLPASLATAGIQFLRLVVLIDYLRENVHGSAGEVLGQWNSLPTVEYRQKRCKFCLPAIVDWQQLP